MPERRFEVREKGLKEAQRQFSKLKQAVGQGRREPMELVGEEARVIIVKRTASGIDVNGAAFKPYSAAYAKQKGKSAADLHVTTEMLGGISVNAWAKKVRIFLKGNYAFKIGRVHNVGGRSGRGTGFQMPKREFMGVTRERDMLVKVANVWWSAYVRSLGLAR
jgi:phage gpG-like protein